MQRDINGASLRKMFVGGVALLDQNKKLVDALNVFPVPDGDTGTNMFLTLKCFDAKSQSVSFPTPPLPLITITAFFITTAFFCFYKNILSQISR